MSISVNNISSKIDQLGKNGSSVRNQEMQNEESALDVRMGRSSS